MEQDQPSYLEVHKLLAQHCASCHGAKEPKGDLTLDSFQGVMKGGETGPVIVPGKPAESLLLQQIEHKTKPYMPPPKKGRKLTDAEIGVVRAWIVAGAPGPRPGEVLPKIVAVPRIEPKVAPRKAIQAIAYEPKARLIAIARAGEIELRSAEHRGVVRTLTGHAGSVNAIAFTADGAVLAAAGGEAGLSGEVRLWNVADGALLKTFKGHEDAIYAIALAPDGKTFATGSYDHEILIWDKAQDAPLRTLHGHNEAVFSVAFRPDGKILASVSADRTVKLWDVATGQRRDTLTESTKSLHTVAFSPDGQFVAAGGVDNRIRIWQVSAEAKEGTNAIRHSAFAHEGAILRLAWSADGKTILSSADDKTVKLWKASDMSPRLVLEAQSDWPTALSFALDGKAVVVGRLDGGFAIYDAATGKAMVPPKPEVSRVEPRALARGATAKVKVFGKNLGGVNALTVHHPKVQGKLEDAAADSLSLSLVVPADLPPGEFDLQFAGPGGDGGRVKLFVEALPLVHEVEGTEILAPLPASFWGSLTARGDADTVAFTGTKGQTLVVDAAARRLGSKAELMVTLADAAGGVVASSLEFEGEADPLIVATLPSDGKYVVRVRDLQLGASPDHFYRLAIGGLPVVTGVYPLAVPANAETEVRLVGANLPAGAVATVKSGASGEVAVPADPERFRVRRDLKVMVSAVPESVEAEPNDRPDQALAMSAPGGGNGRINAPGDADLYRFETKAGKPWVIETQAAQRGSPADTRIEILHADGSPVNRVLLRAVRDSYITFRPVDPNGNGARLWQYEEMDLGQYLYMQGEVVRLFLAPRGPDSQWDFFTMGGRRRCYFDTSAVAHALDEPAYIVEPHPPGTTLPPNGLPVFPLVYANDDDGDRRLGTDSRIHFTAPADGAYLVRVRDTRGSGSIRHAYRLVIRESKPDFSVALEGANPNLPAGSGIAFTVRVNRVDGFDGAVSVEITGAPPGFSVSSPVVIEAGHLEAKGTIYVAADAPKPEKAALKVVAKAMLGGQEVARDVAAPGMLAIAEKPRTVVWLEPESAAGDVITVKPGGMVSAKLRIQRTGHNERVTFDVENLPFGVIVDDIGLNGILIPEGATERTIFLTCAAWVAETTRPCYARIREGANPTSKPLMLRVPAVSTK